MPQLTRCSDSWLVASGSKAGGNQRQGVRDKGDAAEMGEGGVCEEGAAMSPGPSAVFRFQDNARCRCARAEEGASLGTQPDWGRRWGVEMTKALEYFLPEGGREGGRGAERTEGFPGKAPASSQVGGGAPPLVGRGRAGHLRTRLYFHCTCFLAKLLFARKPHIF